MKELMRRLNNLEKSLDPPKQEPHIIIDWDTYSFYMPHNGKRYIPSKTGYEFHASREVVRCVRGPVNSGKSTMMCADPILTACMLPPFLRDGVRRARFGFCRSTYPLLKTTTLLAWTDWFDGFGIVPPDRDKYLIKNSPYSFRTLFYEGSGWVDLEIVFLALDKEADVEKLDSLNYTGLFFNEVRYMQEAIVGRAQQRVRRYPASDDIGTKVALGGVTMDTNPPNYGHWYQVKEELKPKEHRFWVQPPGLLEDESGALHINPEAENLAHMPDGFYLNAAAGLDYEDIKVQLMGKFGISSKSRGVYADCYNDDLHSVESIQFSPGLPVLMGWDFGDTPAVVMGQMTVRGRLLLIKEFCAESGALRSFLENMVMPYCNSELADYEFICWIDPAGFSPVQTDARSCYNELSRFFTNIKAAKTNLIRPRLTAVREGLGSLVDGLPKLQLSREGCPTTREGFKGEYCFKQIRTVNGLEYTQEPLKNRYSHSADAVHYICLGAGFLDDREESSNPQTDKGYRIIQRRGFA